MSKVGGHNVYRSAILEKLWPFGFSTIGAVTFESAAYVARYVMKKWSKDSLEGKELYDAMLAHGGDAKLKEVHYNGLKEEYITIDRKSTRLNSSHSAKSRMPSSA